MSIKTISRFVVLAAIVFAAAHVFSTTRAAAGIFGTKYLDQTGCCHRCPSCDHVCKLDAEKGETEKTCYEVECKTICIPRVVFPWQMKNCKSCSSCDGNGCSSCINNGAKLRKVRVLKSKKYTCPECKYSWSAEKVGGGCATGACDGGCAGACDAGVSVPNANPVPNATPAPNATPGPEALPAPTDALPSPAAAYGRPTPNPLPSIGALPPWMQR